MSKAALATEESPFVASGLLAQHVVVAAAAAAAVRSDFVVFFSLICVAKNGYDAQHVQSGVVEGQDGGQSIICVLQGQISRPVQQDEDL
jgi:hypothetical protein